MPHLIISYIIGLCFTAILPVYPDAIPEDLEKWIHTDLPKEDSERLQTAKGDPHDWVVTLRDGRPRVQPFDWKSESLEPLPFAILPGTALEGLAGKRLCMRAADGWIVAYNAGEFGAGLWWFSADGKHRYKIAEAWIQKLFTTEIGLLAIEWLPFGDASKGRVTRLIQNPEGRWQTQALVELKDAPQTAAKAADGSLLIVTRDRLLRVVPATKELRVLVGKGFWSDLYPTSMIITPMDIAYVGMRHGVLKIEQRGELYQLRWLLPNQAFVEMKPKVGFR